MQSLSFEDLLQKYCLEVSGVNGDHGYVLKWQQGLECRLFPIKNLAGLPTMECYF
jgi:hypothetical protein